MRPRVASLSFRLASPPVLTESSSIVSAKICHGGGWRGRGGEGREKGGAEIGRDVLVRREGVLRVSARTEKVKVSTREKGGWHRQCLVGDGQCAPDIQGVPTSTDLERYSLGVELIAARLQPYLLHAIV